MEVFGALIVATGFFFFEWRHMPLQASKKYLILSYIGAWVLIIDGITRAFSNDPPSEAGIPLDISFGGLGMMVIFGFLYIRSRQRSI